MSLKSVSLAAVVLVAAASGAYAQTCEKNFASEGVPLVTNITYKSWQVFPKVAVKVALSNLAGAVAAEGFDNIKVDRSLSMVLATQETSGSGREQRLRVTVRKSGGGSRVDVAFMVQQGQVAPTGTTRSAICRLLKGATG